MHLVPEMPECKEEVVPTLHTAVLNIPGSAFHKGSRKLWRDHLHLDVLTSLDFTTLDLRILTT